MVLTQARAHQCQAAAPGESGAPRALADSGGGDVAAGGLSQPLLGTRWKDLSGGTCRHWLARHRSQGLTTAWTFSTSLHFFFQGQMTGRGRGPDSFFFFLISKSCYSQQQEWGTASSEPGSKEPLSQAFTLPPSPLLSFPPSSLPSFLPPPLPFFLLSFLPSFNKYLFRAYECQTL